VEAIAILKEVAPKLKDSEEQKALELIRDHSVTDNTKGHALGWMAEQDWQATVDLMTEYLGLKDAPSLDRIYTNDFLPQE
jgi:hypothetical protein